VSVWPFRSDSREVAAVARLIDAGGAFAQSGGPALLVTGPRAVKTVNAAGRPLANALIAGRIPELESLIASAISGKAPAAAPLALGEGEGRQQVEVTVLGLDGGAGALVLGRDATLERNLQSALIESRQRFRDLVEISSDFAWEVGPKGRFVFVSPKGALGHAADQLVGRRPEELGGDASVQGDLPFLARARVEASEIWLKHADGHDVCLRVSAAPLTDAAGVWRGVRGVCRDITAERERDAELAAAQNRRLLLTRIIRTIRDEVDPEAMLGAAATAVIRALGAGACVLYRGEVGQLKPAAHRGVMPHGAALAQVIQALAAADGLIEVDLQAYGGEGKVLAAATSYRGKINGALLLWRNARDRAFTAEESELAGEVAAQLAVAYQQLANHEELTRLSSTDTLTGLKNRRMFFSEVGKRLAQGTVAGTGGALIYVDLDNFKIVNDIKGHQAGDEALKAVARLLADATRGDDVVARLGGDEFALWLDKVDAAAAIRLAERLLASTRLLSDYSGDPTRPLGFSIGMATYEPGSGEDLDSLVARGDESMYVSKRGGKGRYHMAPPAKAK
jgi:diguanylate cyclase (GGDEF)-like protein/PAS domain S-box-containing protein